MKITSNSPLNSLIRIHNYCFYLCWKHKTGYLFLPILMFLIKIHKHFKDELFKSIYTLIKSNISLLTCHLFFTKRNVKKPKQISYGYWNTSMYSGYLSQFFQRYHLWHLKVVCDAKSPGTLMFIFSRDL